MDDYDIVPTSGGLKTTQCAVLAIAARLRGCAGATRLIRLVGCPPVTGVTKFPGSETVL
jgi:hypothetical protein